MTFAFQLSDEDSTKLHKVFEKLRKLKPGKYNSVSQMLSLFMTEVGIPEIEHYSKHEAGECTRAILAVHLGTVGEAGWDQINLN